MYVCTYLRIYVCMYVFMHVCTYVYIYVCMYVGIRKRASFMEQSSPCTASNNMCVTNSLSSMEFDVFQAA